MSLHVITFITEGLPDLTIDKVHRFRSVPYRQIQQKTAPSGRLFSQKSFQKRLVTCTFGVLESYEKSDIISRIVDQVFHLRFFNEETQQYEEGEFLLLDGKYENGTMRDVSSGLVWIDFGFSAVEVRGY